MTLKIHFCEKGGTIFVTVVGDTHREVFYLTTLLIPKGEEDIWV